jgi:glutaredoxin 1
MPEENNKIATIYGKTICSYCKLAKDVLIKNNYQVNYINLDDDTERKLFYDRVSKELPGPVTSVPQIWISNKYIGGYNDLIAYLKQEKEIVFDKDF